MDDLTLRLRALSRHEHSDLTVGDEAADAIKLRNTYIEDLRAKSGAWVAEIGALRSEAVALRLIVCECARAVGASVAADCSLQFLADVPREVEAVCKKAQSDRAQIERCYANSESNLHLCDAALQSFQTECAELRAALAARVTATEGESPPDASAARNAIQFALDVERITPGSIPRTCLDEFNAAMKVNEGS